MLKDKLKQLRETRKLTKKQAAGGIGVTERAYIAYEYGERDVSTEQLSKIADFYGITTDYLLGREPCNDPVEQLPVGEQDRAIVQAYINLSEKERTQFVEVLRKIAAGADVKMVISHDKQQSEIQITQNSELAIARSSKSNYKPAPTDEQFNSFDVLTDDMLGE